MVSFRLFGACALALPILGATAAPTPDFQTVELLNSVPEGWTKAEAPAPDTPLRFRLAVQQDNAELFEQMVVDLSNPGHSTYGRHMKRDEVKSFLRPASHVTDAILSWLKAEGVPEESIQEDGDWINFEVPVSQAESMLHTTFNYFRSTENDAKIIRTLEYSVPRSVFGYIHMIQPTTRFGRPRPRASTILDIHFAEIPDLKNVECNTTITPACLRDLYKIGDFTAKQDPKNKLGVSGYLKQYARIDDFNHFVDILAPASKGNKFDVVSINGGLNEQNSNEDSTEASLDVDYGIGLTNASAVYYTTGGLGKLVPDLDQPDQSQNQNEPYLEQLHYLRDLPDDQLPAVLSTSYGENEQSVPEKYAESACNLFAQLGARGVSVIFSSGDDGPGSSCQTNDEKKTPRFNPIFPAACPFVTSVGGTFHIKPEQAVPFSSGGFSERYKQPKYQNDAVKDYLKILGKQWDGLYNPQGRGFPDVAAQGYNFAVVDHGKVVGVSGTSASAPLFAGIVTMLNTVRLEAGKPRLGFLNPFLYGAGRAGFTDVQHGGSQGCTGKSRAGLPSSLIPYASWNATEGWDPVTGIGTPNFDKLKELVLSA